MKKAFTFIASLTAICALMCGCSHNSSNDSLEGYEKVSMHASWEYAYKDIEELTDSSDLIARVRITDGEKIDRNGITMTEFSANVEDLILGSGEETVDILMTGGINHNTKQIFEISDDPLMQTDDEFIIFARKNTSGTYTVLGGPQGRFVIDNDLVYPLSHIASRSVEINAQNSADNSGKNIDDFISEVRSYI